MAVKTHSVELEMTGTNRCPGCLEYLQNDDLCYSDVIKCNLLICYVTFHHANMSM